MEITDGNSHILRMQENKIPKKTLKTRWKENKRKTRTRWEDEIRKDTVNEGLDWLVIKEDKTRGD